MNEWVKALLTSSVVAGLVGWFTASQKIEQELHTKQGEAAYEKLIEANSLFWQYTPMLDEANRKNDDALRAAALEIKTKSDAAYRAAQHKIAVYGDERVVKAMSDYYKYDVAKRPCEEPDKRRLDTEMYLAIRNTLGVGGRVSHEQLATLMFLCTLEEPKPGSPGKPGS